LIRAVGDAGLGDAAVAAVAVAPDHPAPRFVDVEQVLLPGLAEVHRAPVLDHRRQPLVPPHPKALRGVLAASECYGRAAAREACVIDAAAVRAAVHNLAMGGRVVLLVRKHVPVVYRALATTADPTTTTGGLLVLT